MRMELTEQGVFRYPHPSMDGWRYYRIEYYAGGPYDVEEQGIWLPPHVDPCEVEDFFDKLCKEV